MAAKNLTRREFVRGATALFLGGLASGRGAVAADEPTLHANARMLLQGGPKVALQMSPEPTEADLQFARQMGVEYVVLWTGGAEANYDYFGSRRELFEKAGLKIYGFGNSSVHCQAALVLNLPDRDEKVAEYKRYLRALGKAGIPYTTYAHMANGVWSTAPEQTRGGAKARAFDLDKASHQTLTHGRKYTEVELWDNYTHFITEVAPVAEEAGVIIGIHPDDPPGVELGGILPIVTWQGWLSLVCWKALARGEPLAMRSSPEQPNRPIIVRGFRGIVRRDHEDRLLDRLREPTVPPSNQ